MKQKNYYQEISLNELTTALDRELKAEEPLIPEVKKFLLIDLMIWDIRHQGYNIPLSDSQKLDNQDKKFTLTKNHIIERYSPLNKEITIYHRSS